MWVIVRATIPTLCTTARSLTTSFCTDALNTAPRTYSYATRALKPWTHSISSSGCYVLNLYFIWLWVELGLTLLARTSLTDALPCSTDFKDRDLGAGFFPTRAYPKKNSIENRSLFGYPYRFRLAMDLVARF